MNYDISKSIDIYKETLEKGIIQFAYRSLINYIAELKIVFSKDFKVGNISLGYLDYSYFPFSNEFFRKYKLRFGIVLNHNKMQFELWLMGQNATVQKEYWEILKNTIWNEGLKEMPKYSVLEVSLVDNLDFNNKEEMTKTIFNKSILIVKKIEEIIKDINN